jgi:hypothetical protein
MKTTPLAENEKMRDEMSHRQMIWMVCSWCKYGCSQRRTLLSAQQRPLEDDTVVYSTAITPQKCTVAESSDSALANIFKFP